MRKILKKLLLSSILFGMSGIALAMPITFDFTGGPNGNGDPLLYSQGGIDLEVSGTPGIAVDRNQGLGVRTSFLDSNQIDGFGPDETLIMVFSPLVQVLSIHFGAVGFNDDFTLSVDGPEVLNQDIPGGSLFGTNSVLDVSGFNLVGSDFRFSVTGFNDDYYVRKITVKDVPEPGALALLGIGLAGLGFTRGKKHTA